MTRPAAKLLDHILQEEALEERSVLFLMAEAMTALGGSYITAVQPWVNQRTIYQQIYGRTEELDPAAHYDFTLLLCPKNMIETRYLIAQGLRFLKEHGVLIAAAENDAGGKRLDSLAKELGSPCGVTTKHKSRAIRITKSEVLNADKLLQWLKEGEAQQNNAGYWTQPGLFSWDKVDIGSRLLLNTLSDKPSGHIGDFGCGYGFISHGIAQKDTAITKMSMIDADSRALHCAEKNMRPYQKIFDTRYHWADLSQPFVLPHKCDMILMNPPFHTGKAQQYSLGQFFNENAAQNLKPGGTLWMVANSHLPYEKIVDGAFSKNDIIEQKQGFKIIRAVR